jgi:predicted CoA-substrate-specific enzyme activase
MITAGIDIGSTTSKGVIMEDDKILSYSIIPTGPDSVKTATNTINSALNGLNLSVKDINYIVATGYGRVLVPFANKNISEISCHARGANFYFPTVRTILDMGGQDCKAINCNEKGEVTHFVMNEKCAGGTGRFLEIIADIIQVPLEEIGGLSLQSKNNIQFNTYCVLFAKSEAMLMLKKGIKKEDILRGLHEAMASRCLNLLKRIKIEKDFSITGGISKNIGMVKMLREKVGLEPLIAPDPQIVGAIGAAIFAKERYINGV